MHETCPLQLDPTAAQSVDWIVNFVAQVRKFGFQWMKLFGHTHDNIIPRQVLLFIRINVFYSKSWNKPFEIVLITSECHNNPYKSLPGYLGSDVTRRLFREWTWEHGNKPKSGSSAGWYQPAKLITFHYGCGMVSFLASKVLVNICHSLSSLSMREAPRD